MSTEYVEHITTEGERWDQLAQKYYGNPLLTEPIVTANPTVVLTMTLPGGLSLLVPVMDTPPESTADLPPWRR